MKAAIYKLKAREKETKATIKSNTAVDEAAQELEAECTSNLTVKEFALHAKAVSDTVAQAIEDNIPAERVHGLLAKCRSASVNAPLNSAAEWSSLVAMAVGHLKAGEVVNEEHKFES